MAEHSVGEPKSEGKKEGIQGVEGKYPANGDRRHDRDTAGLSFETPPTTRHGGVR
jgi:hypothetical protein